MTGEQLIEKLKNHLTIEDFAYDEIPYDKNFSENALKAQEIKDQWLKNNPSPGYLSPNYDKWITDYSAIPSCINIAQKEWLLKNNIPEWVEVEQYGGEGKGDLWYSVKCFPSLNIYLKIEGSYESYDGVDLPEWNYCKIVRPKEKTITVYKEI